MSKHGVHPPQMAIWPQCASLWRRSTPSAIQQAGCGWRALAALAYPSAAMRMLESSGFSGVVTASALLPLAKVEVGHGGTSSRVGGQNHMGRECNQRYTLGSFDDFGSSFCEFFFWLNHDDVTSG